MFNKIVLLTSRGSKVNPDVLVITVLSFNSCGSRSNRKLTEFQSIPFPAKAGYPPVALASASTIAAATKFSSAIGSHSPS